MRAGSLVVRNAPGSVAQSVVVTALPREKEEEGEENKKNRTRMRIRPGMRRHMTKNKRGRKGNTSEEYLKEVN